MKTQLAKIFLVKYWRGRLLHHCQSAVSSMGRLYRTPLATLMTVFVIGIALALPTGLFLVLDNIKHISGNWHQSWSVSIFLQKNAEADEIKALMKDLQLNQDIADIELITPQQGLTQIQERGDFGEALHYLPDNPLPNVLVIYPISSAKSPHVLRHLKNNLEQFPLVESVQVDMEWLQRLFSLLQLGNRAVILLMFLFGISVVLIIGNTIRMATQNCRQEIDVVFLIGGTPSFIRRPFLYAGLYYGFFGAIITWLIISCAYMVLSGPMSALFRQYHSQYSLHGLSFSQFLVLLILSMGLGLFGSWFAVNRELHCRF